MCEVTAFMFHDIRDCKDSKFSKRYELKSFLSTDEFIRQIEYIKNKYNIISSTDLFYGDVTNNSAVITFDDGLLDQFNILSILKNKGIKATFLIPAEPITMNKVIHSHKIQFILSVVDETELVKKVFKKLRLSRYQEAAMWKRYSKTKHRNNWWSKEMIFLTNVLRDPLVVRYEITDELFRENVAENEADFSKTLYMDEDHIKTLVESGMDIGGHGFSSESLTSVDGELENEIRLSINFVKKFLHNKDRIFYSYPNGGVDDRIVGMLKKYNCHLSYTTVSKFNNNLSNVDFMMFPRVNSPIELPR